jgi:hypothetical protein
MRHMPRHTNGANNHNTNARQSNYTKSCTLNQSNYTKWSMLNQSNYTK